MNGRVRNVSFGMMAVTALYILIPLLALLPYVEDTDCDLGSLGAAIMGWLAALVVLGGAVVAAAVLLARWRVLLVFPGVVGAHWLGANSGVVGWPRALVFQTSACHDPVSWLFVAAIAALGGAATYLLARGAAGGTRTNG